MPATSSKAIPFTCRQLIGGVMGAVAPIRRMGEKATQTFKTGVPVQIEAASGFIIECAAIVSAATAFLAGMATEPGNNLTTNGVAKTLTFGSVQNQASAVLIPPGAPPNDGLMGILLAGDVTVFQGVVGHGTDNTLAVFAATDVGKVFGLTKDAGNGGWYVDKAITTVAGGACVELLELIDAAATVNGKVGFRVLRAAQQLLF